MRPRIPRRTAVIGLLWLAAHATAAFGQPVPDVDSLPPGAIGRLGSQRLRTLSVINSVAFSPDGKYVAAGGENDLKDSSICLWDTVTGDLIRKFGGHWAGFLDLAFTPDGSTLISGGADGVRYWDVQKGTMLNWTKSVDIVRSLAVSHDGKI